MVAGTVVLAVTDLVGQSVIADSRGAIANQTGQLMRGRAETASLPEFPIEGPAEAQVLGALRFARAAGALPPGEQRTRLIAEATRAATAATEIRPNWGEAEVVLAYAASLGTSSEDGLRARRALAASYADAPVLRDSGQWRIRYGVQAWPALDAATHRAILREGVWLLGVDKTRWSVIFDTFRGSQAYVPFMLQWRELLSGGPRPGADSLSEAQAN